ncbi:hypothetical protein FXO37_33221 [Capsicum annuum]|nr:hypothetical protein FXO37_33221 [Capsicum annuum]
MVGQQGSPPSGTFGISDVPKVSPAIGPVGTLNTNRSPLINSISALLMLESPNGVRCPTPLGENPMNASVSVYSGRSNTITTRDNHHPRTVDITKVVMSINFSFNLSTLLNPQILNKYHIHATPTNNGISHPQQYAISKGSYLLQDCTASIQSDTNVVGETRTSRQDHKSLRHCGRPADSTLHPRPILDGVNSERSSGSYSRGVGLPNMMPNSPANPEVRDPQHDELRGNEFTHSPYVKEFFL